MWSGSLINFILLANTGMICYDYSKATDYSKAYLWRRLPNMMIEAIGRPPAGVDW